jgi:hypothetical protein
MDENQTTQSNLRAPQKADAIARELGTPTKPVYTYPEKEALIRKYTIRAAAGLPLFR